MREEIDRILTDTLRQRFHGIATSSDGVFTGYQLDWHTIKDFKQQILHQILSLIRQRIEGIGMSDDEILKIHGQWDIVDFPDEQSAKPLTAKRLGEIAQAYQQKILKELEK
jgi:hypothetical protein